MKTKIILLFFLAPFFCNAQALWRPLGDDDFNSASRGSAALAGRNSIIVKNDHVFLFNLEMPDYGNSNWHFSISKYTGSQWEHIGFPFLFAGNATIDCAVDNNETPYVL